MKRRAAGMLSRETVKRRAREASMRACNDDKWGAPKGLRD
jgi:hypothetical protein